jgi:asparagine synthase (glutamine-hydrolysing)
MSGIAGWIDWNENLLTQGATLTRMVDTVAHRGPDGQGQWLSEHAALAQRRLSVIDLQAGAQPLVYQEGEWTYAITYNGEIYNFRELRRELEYAGHTFRTSSDTEVLLHTYVEWGEECVQHLNGIFAFGIWDGRKQQLLLARDHLGVKPLFYAQRGDALLFGSELKVLLSHPLVDSEVDAAGLAQILTFVRTPDSGIYRDVHALRPGHRAIYNKQGFHISRYWDLHSTPHREDLPTTTEHIRALLDDAIKHQLIADIPIAALLSGGLDSNILTALTAREYQAEGKKLHTYSIDFVDSEKHFNSGLLHLSRDEPWARKVSAHFGTHHHTITLDASALMENMMVQLYAHDISMVGQMNTSLYLLFKAIKQEAGIVLSGEAADEIFGGYPWFSIEAVLNAPTFPWMPAFLGRGEGALSWLSPDVLQRVCPTEHIGQQYRQTLAEVPRLEGEDPVATRRREMFYLNLTHWLPFLLERKDRMGMATGLEVRLPFGDPRLVEYAWNIPWEMKTVDGIEKGIVRRAFADLLPEELRSRKKSAYPSIQNPAYDQATRTWALMIVNDANAPIQALLNQPVALSLLEHESSGRSDIAQVSLFERIILLNEWLDKYHIKLSL